MDQTLLNPCLASTGGTLSCYVVDDLYCDVPVSSDRHSRPSELLDETVKLVTLILEMLSFGMSIPFRRKVRPGERERDGRPDSRCRS